jgi:UPF0716 family protein affecting phage T7 exclusion
LKYFLIYLFLEVVISTQIASYIGAIATFFEIILSAIIGVVVLSNFKYSLFEYAIQLAKGEISQEEFMAKNITTALGAVLLIIPGYFSDILGILLIFDIITTLILKIFKFKQQNIRRDEDEVIDVEIIDNKHTIYE